MSLVLQGEFLTLGLGKSRQPSNTCELVGGTEQHLNTHKARSGLHELSLLRRSARFEKPVSLGLVCSALGRWFCYRLFLKMFIALPRTLPMWRAESRIVVRANDPCHCLNKKKPLNRCQNQTTVEKDEAPNVQHNGQISVNLQRNLAIIWEQSNLADELGGRK